MSKADHEFVTVLDALAKAPKFAWAGAVLFAFAAGYVIAVSFNPLLSPILAVVFIMLAVFCIGIAFVGMARKQRHEHEQIQKAKEDLNKRRRQEHFASQHSIEDLRALTWQKFEEYVADLFRRQGYRVEEVGGPGDGGIDLILTGPQGAVHLVQCKRWNAWQVGVQELRDFYGAMAGQNARGEGIVVTCGTFTEPAKEFAVNKPIRLIDGAELEKLMNEVNPVTPAVEHFTSAPPGATEDEPAPVCPKCNTPMVKRSVRRGERVGKYLWGCSNFPKCRYVISID